MICYEYFVNTLPAVGTAMNEVTPVTRECQTITLPYTLLMYLPHVEKATLEIFGKFEKRRLGQFILSSTIHHLPNLIYYGPGSPLKQSDCFKSLWSKAGAYLYCVYNDLPPVKAWRRLSHIQMPL